MYATAGILATQYGSTILASHQIVRQIQTIQVVITWSYMSVGQSMIANVYGNLANSPESVKHTAGITSLFILIIISDQYF